MILSNVIDVVAWKTKHDSYYWARKVYKKKG